jgi:hypothetical protein
MLFGITVKSHFISFWRLKIHTVLPLGRIEAPCPDTAGQRMRSLLQFNRKGFPYSQT